MCLGPGHFLTHSLMENTNVQPVPANGTIGHASKATTLIEVPEEYIDAVATLIASSSAKGNPVAGSHTQSGKDAGPTVDQIKQFIPKGVHFKKQRPGAVRTIGWKTRRGYYNRPMYRSSYQKSWRPSYRSFYKRRYY